MNEPRIVSDAEAAKWRAILDAAERNFPAREEGEIFRALLDTREVLLAELAAIDNAASLGDLAEVKRILWEGTHDE